MEEGGVALEERVQDSQDAHNHVIGAWAKIYDEQETYARRIIRRYISDPGAVDELVDDVFFSLYQEMESGKVISHPKTYVAKSAYHVAMSYVRRNDGRENLPLDEQTQQSLWSQSSLSSQTMSLNETLAALPSYDRTILIMRFYDDMFVAEIARALNRDERRMRDDIDAALGRMHKLLERVA